jgi:hypothetical protein
MTHPNAFPIAILPSHAVVGRRDATFAAGRSARRGRGGRLPSDRGAGGGRGCCGGPRFRLHGAAGRDGVKAAA